MKKLLVLSFFPAFNPPQSGGELRLYHLYRELSSFYHVTLISSSHVGGKEEAVYHTDTFIERRIPKAHEFTEQWDVLSPKAGDGDLSGPSIGAAGRLPSMFHAAYLEEYSDADVIIHDSPFTIDYDLFFNIDAKPRIYNSYNCESLLYKQLHPDDKSTPIHHLVYDLELRLLKGADLVIYCGETDLRSFEEMAPLNETMFLPNGTASQATPARPASQGPIRDIVFIGSGHHPNGLAATAIVETIAPEASEFTFHIIGDCLPPGDYPPNVKRYGRIDNVAKAKVIALVDCAINPMTTGSGSSLKVFDFFENRLPLFSTAFGMRGIDASDGEHYVGAEVESFARVLRHWSGRRADLAKIADKAHELVSAKYNWRLLARELRQRLGALTSGKAGPLAGPYVLALNDYDPFGSIGGGATRMRGVYETVANWSPVVFVSFSEGREISVERLSDTIAVMRVPKTAAHVDRERALDSKFHISSRDIVAIKHAPENPHLVALYHALRGKARIVIIEHPYMVGLPDLFCDRFVYSGHNDEIGLKSDALHWHPDRNALMADLIEAEGIAIENSVAVVAVCDEDAERYLRGRSSGAPVTVVHNGCATPAEPGQEDLAVAKRRIGHRSALFLGSAHMPNINAARFIVEKLAATCPDVEFHLVGSLGESFPGPNPKNVVVWGTLDDKLKSAVMQSCRIALNPMMSGSGSNVKVADYLANGLFVITTEFGLRGHRRLEAKHMRVAALEDFAEALKESFSDETLFDGTRRAARQAIFDSNYAMHAHARRFVELLADIEKPKKRLLFVTYRYSWPLLGGAETHLWHLLQKLGESGEFSIDVVATKVTRIREEQRFVGRYDYEEAIGAPTGAKNIRFARFDLDPVDEAADFELGTAVWNAQIGFEKALYGLLRGSITTSGLAWGWSPLEQWSDGPVRWAYRSAGLHLSHQARVRVKARSVERVVLLVQDQDNRILFHDKTSGVIDCAFEAGPGPLTLSVTRDEQLPDQRPLGFAVEQVTIDGAPLDMASNTVLSVAHLPAEQAFEMLGIAAEASRAVAGARLSDIRGPHSSSLERFLEENVRRYDLVLTHNNVFRPPVAAVEAANRADVPVILLPHAHLDDDYYHFPDTLSAVTTATVACVSPRAACTYYEKRGARKVVHHTPGVDVSEAFTAEDVDAFRAVYGKGGRFVLVLGRKSRSKGYRDVIAAVDELAKDTNIRLVMIGPDDDLEPIRSPNVTYLGIQPRNVVRGALQSCLALTAMSISESFGIVILEAWMASRPVIANSDCAAFRDIIVHNENAILATTEELTEAIREIACNEALVRGLVGKGRETLKHHDWEKVARDFVALCREYAGARLPAS
ncbi:MAG TPA: glycosyltransferase [Methylosinus sp.]|jgi:glycosyltransferase involved in cell wall biosynthesis|uniref:glycosyltransferase n=1 Tax=Methylosinus sp. TaxID=427 RepID=UPI002F92914D